MSELTKTTLAGALIAMTVQAMIGQSITKQALAQETKKETLTYKTVDGLAIQADVFRFSDTRQRPVVVWIHGGALIMGHREGLNPEIRDKILKLGYVFVSVDYRLAPETKLPEVVQDVQDSIRWVAERGPELFHADPQRIGVIGGSAGGYLT